MELPLTITHSATLVVLWGALFKVLGSKERGPQNREWLAGVLHERTAASAYRRLVGGVEQLAQAVYGPAHGLRALSVSLVLAAIYPSLFFFLSHAVGDLNTLAGIPLLKEGSSTSWGQLVGDCVFLCGEAVLLGQRHRIDAWAATRLATQTRLSLRRATLALLIALATIALGGMIYFLVRSFGDWSMTLALTLIAGYVAGTAGGGRAGLLASIAVLLCGSIAVIGSAIAIGLVSLVFVYRGHLGTGLVLASAAATGGAGVVDVASAGLFTPEGRLDDRAVSGCLFLVALPLANGLFDWLSLRISRHFIRSARDSMTWVVPLRGILLDILAAIGLIVGLVLLLPALVETLALLPAQNVKLSWQDTAAMAMREPWGQGLVVSLMLLSTLVPTALHIACGVLALAYHWAPLRPLEHRLRKMRNRTRLDSDNDFDPAIAATWIVAYVACLLIVAELLLRFTAGALHWPVAKLLYQLALNRTYRGNLILVPLALFLGAAPIPRWLGLSIGNR